MTSLTPEQLRQIHAALAARRRALVEEIRNELARSDQEHYIDLAERVRDVGDESVAAALTDMHAAIVDRQVHELREIDAAEKRIADGTYGICVTCGETIPFERLLASPTATRDIAHQQLFEKTRRGVSPHSL